MVRTVSVFSCVVRLIVLRSGFTPQYKGLQGLYDKYKEKGLVILGFPCNQVRFTRYFIEPTRLRGGTQFGGQEPGSDEEIASFCELNHGVSFPLMKKTDVNGDHTNEVYKYLKAEKAGILGLTRIKVRLSLSLTSPCRADELARSGTLRSS